MAAKKKIEGSLAGLIEPKDELEQVVSVIPTDLSREFVAILNSENISMAKGVALAISLFNARLRDQPQIKRTDKQPKTVTQLMKEYLEGDKGRADLKGDFIGRIPKGQFDEFHAIRKKLRLKVYEATTIATTLLIRYYREHRGKKI